MRSLNPIIALLATALAAATLAASPAPQDLEGRLATAGFTASRTGELHESPLRLASTGTAVRTDGPGDYVAYDADGTYAAVHAATQGALDQLVATATSDPAIVRLEPVPTATLETAPARWADQPVNAGTVHASYGLTGRGVDVAVIDSGIDVTHPDLRGAVTRARSLIPTINPRSDELGHGTAVAGIIGARDNGTPMTGVAPDSNLWPLLVFIDSPHGNGFQIVDAVNYATAAGADVINMSLSVPFDFALLGDAVRKAHRKGIVVVAAAGNTGTGGARAWPAAYPETIAVGAVDHQGEVASFSTVADYVDVHAPGVDVTAPWPHGQDYRAVNGTSYAAPFVTGIATLLREAYPDAPPEQVRDWIVAGARPMQPGGVPVVNVPATLQASGTPTPATAPRPLTSGRCPAVSATTFADVTTELAPAVGCLASRGVTRGLTNERFGPEQTLTRGQLASFVSRALTATGSHVPAVAHGSFSDVDGTTHQQAIEQLADAGILAGYPDGTFRPEATVTRGHIATYLVAAHEAATARPLAMLGRDRYPDTAGTTHEGSIGTAAGRGWLHTNDRRGYRPADPLLRGDMAAFLTRWLGDLDESASP